MSQYPEERSWRGDLAAFGARLKKSLSRNWGLKLTSLIIAVAVWGGLISQDASLTREKSFSDVAVSIVNADALQRSGFIVVSDLSKLTPIRMRADVPQRVYDSATPANFNPRLDLSRISAKGEVTLPIQTTDTISYGRVTWLSQSEVTVEVDEYITRRRIPVQSVSPAGEGELPEDVYAGTAGIDPNSVVISGPRSLVAEIARVVPAYDIAKLTPILGTQYNAVPFTLVNRDGGEIKSPLITVTSENVLLDTLLVEQTFYPQKDVPINLTGAVTGQVAPGYRIASVTATPAEVKIAASAGLLDKIVLADLALPIDVTGMTETIIRAAKVIKPSDAVYISENAVYVTVEIVPLSSADGEAP